MKKFLFILTICMCGFTACKKTTTSIAEKTGKTVAEKVLDKAITLSAKELKPALAKAITVLPKESQEYFLEVVSKNPKLLVIFEENPTFVSTWEYLRKWLPKECTNPDFIDMFVYANKFASYSGNKLENFIYEPMKDGTISVLTKEGKVFLAKIKPGRVIEVVGEDVNNWFLQLKPFPKAKYIINGAEYLTDDAGRVVKSKVKLSSTTIGKSHRDSGVQKQMASLKNSHEGDDAGHLIADQFGGSSNMVNLVPMKGDINKGTYKQMENEWRKLIDAGKEVDVDINVKYPSAPPGCERPDWIEVIYVVDGKTTTKLFKNID